MESHQIPWFQTNQLQIPVEALGLDPLRDLAVAGDPARLQGEAGDRSGNASHRTGESCGKGMEIQGKSRENPGKSWKTSWKIQGNSENRWKQFGKPKIQGKSLKNWSLRKFHGKSMDQTC